jgi:hypothetical protein
MKTDKNFRLSKSTKRVLASIPHEFRNSYKRMMIDAEYCESRAKLAKVKDKE